jgi:uncharacterized lipoprotein YddW (UPF0748 family)
MRKLIRVALACSLTAGAVVLLLWPLLPAGADDPVPWEEYGGMDGYYLARGWTDGYVSAPLVIPTPTPQPMRSMQAMPYSLWLPLAQRSPLRETRAVWVSRWDFRTLSDVQSIVDKAAYANLNVILFQVRGQADALYTPGLEPWSAVLSGTLGRHPGWDPLAEMITRAHNRGIEVHAWINVYPAWLGASAPLATARPEPMYHAFNRQQGDQWVHWTQGPPAAPTTLSSHYLWASPGNPAVVDHIVAVCRDLLQRYDLDGLHFDYIRYNDMGRPYSFDPVSQAAYTAARAANPSLTYGDWQRAQITAFLQRVHQEVLPARPEARLTAAVWPIYDKTRYSWFPSTGPGGYNDLYQDSEGWARGGLLSGIMPMLYTQSVHGYRDRFEQLCHDFVGHSQPGSVFAGIQGDYTSFEEIAWRIETARAAGARGQALFSYRLFDQNGYWPHLRNGPYKNVALPDWP